jgi:hypothetical protein
LVPETVKLKLADPAFTLAGDKLEIVGTLPAAPDDVTVIVPVAVPPPGAEFEIVRVYVPAGKGGVASNVTGLMVRTNWDELTNVTTGTTGVTMLGPVITANVPGSSAVGEVEGGWKLLPVTVKLADRKGPGTIFRVPG